MTLSYSLPCAYEGEGLAQPRQHEQDLLRTANGLVKHSTQVFVCKANEEFTEWEVSPVKSISDMVIDTDFIGAGVIEPTLNNQTKNGGGDK